MRSSVAAGAQLLVVQSNNATFGYTAETYQQLAMSRLRAIENGRTVVQATTTGMSAIIDPSGRVVAESGPLFRPAILERSVPIRTGLTLATRVGAWPEYVLCLLVIIGVGLVVATDRRRGGGHPRDAAPVESEERVRA